MAGDGLISTLDALPHNHVSHVLEVTREHGYAIDGELKEADAEIRLAIENHSDLPREVFHRFLSRVLALTDIPALGVLVGQKFSLIDYGVLGYACISSPTLSHLLDTFFRFQQLVGSGTHYRETLLVRGDKAVIDVQTAAADAELERFEIELLIGQWSSAMEEFFPGDSNQFTRVNLTFAKPTYSETMGRLLRSPIEYGASRNEVIFPAAMLDAPIRMANKLTSELCEQQCETILENLTRQEGIVDQVRRLIINLPGEVPAPERIAEKLNISYRTLRRRLLDEGTSFKEIHNEVRMGIAAEYLRQTDLTIQEITFLLGYSEVSNFHRAFKAWHDRTPGAYREAMRAASQA